MLQQQIKVISFEPCNDNCPNECQCLFVNIRSFLEFSRLHCNFCFCNWLKQLNSLHSITNCDAVDQILFKFRINKLTSHKIYNSVIRKIKGIIVVFEIFKKSINSNFGSFICRWREFVVQVVFIVNNENLNLMWKQFIKPD